MVEREWRGDGPLNIFLALQKKMTPVWYQYIKDYAFNTFVFQNATQKRP